jgi:hypothetical protein
MLELIYLNPRSELLMADSSVIVPYLSQIEEIKAEIDALKEKNGQLDEKNSKLERTVHYYVQMAETVRISDLVLPCLTRIVIYM